MTLPLWETGAGSEARTVTLVRLAGEVARAVGTLGLLAVEGEIHRPTTGRSGWTWFVLRDRAAQIEVKVPRTNARHCRVMAGERARVVGRLEWTPDRGQVHLVAEQIAPVGAGAVAALLAETRAQLAADGLLDRPRRKVPLLPEIVGVVCGSEAAVKKDIQSVVAARFPGYPVRFEEVTVSGPGAPAAITAAMASLSRFTGVEVIVLARGGGDATSLLPWSSEEVCRAVATSAVPVVSAIGHEGDRPLCDEVADLRCGTPSIAAAAVIPDRASLESGLAGLSSRRVGVLNEHGRRAGRRLAAVDTASSLRRGVIAASKRLVNDRVRLGDLHPRRRLPGCRERLGAIDPGRRTFERLGRAAGRLDADARHLRALAPQRVLERGFAVLTAPSGVVVRRAREVSVGEALAVTLAAGRLVVRVEEIGHRDEFEGLPIRASASLLGGRI